MLFIFSINALKKQYLVLLFLFCFIAINAQEKVTYSKFQSFEFIDADESEDEITSELLKLKFFNATTFENSLIFSHESGYFEEGFELQIQSFLENDDLIYYTLDGSIPTNKSEIYTGKLAIEIQQYSPYSFEAIVLRARAYSENEPSSKIVSKTYLIDPDMKERYSYPIVSLITDPGNFFDYDTGIYVAGANYDPTNPVWSGNYFMTGIEWERDVHIQYFTADGEMVLDQDAGVRIHGARQRSAPQKSLRLYARSEYGESTFNYSLLPQKSKSVYKRFLLKTSYGCWNSTVIKDHLAASIVKGLNFEMQDYRPVIVLLNGNYWGIQTVRDYLGIYHFSDKYNIDESSVNIGLDLKAYEGIPDKYVEVEDILDNKDLTDPAVLDEIAEKMDMNSLINYYNSEIYLNNYDWPSGNRRWWNSSEYDNGKLRWVFYDLDAAFDARGGIGHDMLYQATIPSSSWPNPPYSTKLLSSLLQNEQFKNDFITRAAYLMNYYFHADTIIPEINRIKAEYAPEMEEHITRWYFGSYSDWENNIDSALVVFAQNRRAFVNQHYTSKFSLSGTSMLTLSVNNDQMGQIYLNDMLVSSKNNIGEYFNDVPISLIAVPKLGYKFSHWVDYPSSDPNTITITLSSDIEIHAVFETDPESILGIKINEAMASNSSSILDNHEEFEDWIEILNESSVAVNLSDYYLTDDLGLPFKWKIPEIYPDSVTLQSQSYGLFFADNEIEQGVLHTNFKLNSSGETIAIIKNVSGIPVIVDSMTYTSLPSDLSWGRYPDGEDEYFMFTKPTPGQPNMINSSNTTGIYINELLASNTSDILDNYNEFEDWIEIYNANYDTVDIGGLYISDDFSDLGKNRITSSNPKMTKIPPNGFLLFFADDDEIQGDNHLSFKLSKDGEVVVLSELTEDGFELLDFVIFDEIESNYSYGRLPDGGNRFSEFYFTTPNASNGNLLSTNEISQRKDFVIFPNPASEHINILINCEENQTNELIIFNMTGSQVKSVQFNGSTKTVDISDLVPGIYIVKILGKSMLTMKLIVK